MEDSWPKIDERLIDELVSGQLNGEQYRAALRALDAEPAKWRACALAFLEEQALRSELQVLAQSDIELSDRTAFYGRLSLRERMQKGYFRGAKGDTDSPLDANRTPQVRGKHECGQALPQPNWTSSKFRSILSTAALLLVSFTVGWLGSEVLAERRVPKAKPVTDLGLGSFAQSPPHQVNGLSDSNPTVSTQYVFDRAGSLDSGMPRSIRELERDGRISVELFNVLMPATLEDGSPAVIPVQEMRLGRGRLESY